MTRNLLREKLSQSDVPIWMDEVECNSNSTDFLKCAHDGWGEEDCSHSEDVLLACDYKSDAEQISEDEQRIFDFTFGKAKIALWNMGGKYPYRKV